VRSVKEMNVLGLFVPDEGLVRVAKGTRSWPQVVALLARSAFIFHNHSMGLEISRLRNIKMLILDVDGILTDCRIWMDTQGEWRRFFSIRDGVGLKRIIESGYKVALITGSKAEDIRARVKSLGIHYLHEGNLNKEPAYLDVKNKSGLEDSEIAYMGDDYFDLPILRTVGFSATVPDAMEEVKEAVHYITLRPGGNGAVREVSDYIFKYGAFNTSLLGRAE
jgi:3-deoxy-D-manno-octulosonate 8-phosphate phosphatase (KDO 8-P phosphatase)